MAKAPCTYILTNKPYGTLYVGVTASLASRVWQHRQRLEAGFTARYDLTRLVHFEFLPDMHTAIRREKQLKGWHRRWKIRLIESKNPAWRDLFPDILS